MRRRPDRASSATPPWINVAKSPQPAITLRRAAAADGQRAELTWGLGPRWPQRGQPAGGEDFIKELPVLEWYKL
jgi:hypothetical protein